MPIGPRMDNKAWLTLCVDSIIAMYIGATLQKLPWPVTSSIDWFEGQVGGAICILHCDTYCGRCDGMVRFTKLKYLLSPPKGMCIQ